MVATGPLVVRTLVAFALSYALGFERELRGSPAGDRTFSLVGTACAAITAVAFRSSPQTVAGVITGVGFIGGGLMFHTGHETVRGLTTAATIFATAGLGIVIGAGYLLFGCFVAALMLVSLEVRYVPFLSVFDARRYRNRVRDDDNARDDGRDDDRRGDGLADET
jgi:putative Mg2+ transporter-C (MgtC) family protein